MDQSMVMRTGLPYAYTFPLKLEALIEESVLMEATQGKAITHG